MEVNTGLREKEMRSTSILRMTGSLRKRRERKRERESLYSVTE